MTPKHLRYFVHVVEYGSFTKAAAALSVRQPTLSRLVRQLETEMGHRLLLRDGRGVRLTEEGSVLMKHARGILQQIESVHQDIANVKGSPIGKVVIGAPPSVGQAFLVRLVNAFRRQFPNAFLEIIDGKSWTIHEWLINGTIDIGIIYNPRPSALVEVTPLSEEKLFLISPAAKSMLRRNDKVPVADLCKYPLILPSRAHSMRAVAEIAAASAGIKLNVPLQVEGTPFILALVRAGQGCTVLPRHTVSESRLPGLQLNPIVRPELTRITAMGVSTQRPITYLTQETMKLVRSDLKFER